MGYSLYTSIDLLGQDINIRTLDKALYPESLFLDLQDNKLPLFFFLPMPVPFDIENIPTYREI